MHLPLFVSDIYNLLIYRIPQVQKAPTDSAWTLQGVYHICKQPMQPKPDSVSFLASIPDPSNAALKHIDTSSKSHKSLVFILNFHIRGRVTDSGHGKPGTTRGVTSSLRGVVTSEESSELALNLSQKEHFSMGFQEVTTSSPPIPGLMRC